jgi:phosphate transport system protein
MIRTTFDRDLQAVQDEMLALGSIIEEALTNAVTSLKARDFERSRALILQDHEINQKRFEIEQEVIDLITNHQLMASDSRMLAAILELTSELERIGDYAKGIAKINLQIGREELIMPSLSDITQMAEKAREMLHRGLEAFIQGDIEAARAIPEEDEAVDARYEQLYRKLITYIMEDPRSIEQANYLLWAAHDLERAADRVTNLCERVIFTVTGELEELDADEELALLDSPLLEPPAESS